jgi:hypothetical protein
MTPRENMRIAMASVIFLVLQIASRPPEIPERGRHLRPSSTSKRLRRANQSVKWSLIVFHSLIYRDIFPARGSRMNDFRQVRRYYQFDCAPTRQRLDAPSRLSRQDRCTTARWLDLVARIRNACVAGAQVVQQAPTGTNHPSRPAKFSAVGRRGGMADQRGNDMSSDECRGLRTVAILLDALAACKKSAVTATLAESSTRHAY